MRRIVISVVLAISVFSSTGLAFAGIPSFVVDKGVLDKALEHTDLPGVDIPCVPPCGGDTGDGGF